MSQKLVPPPGMLEQLRKYDANARWANEHPSELLPQVGKFVAVDGGRLVGVSDSEEDLQKRLTKRPAAYVTFVYPPDLAWVLRWVGSRSATCEPGQTLGKRWPILA